jgi:LmbE family N-acetylglucosaminyl deacetylase
MLVISPHLDDAVFGCARLLAARPGSTVLTLFAGTPADGAQLTPWDARCGFGSAEEAMAVRRREDRAALALLGATPHWLDFCDSQYGQTPTPAALAAAVRRVVQDLSPHSVLFPLGLYHSDHLLAHDACMAALRDTGIAAFAYEDALYRGMPGQLQQRLAALAAQRTQATPVRLALGGSDELKAQAVRAYDSQLRSFGAGGYEDTAQPERCWRLDAAPAEATTGVGP